MTAVPFVHADFGRESRIRAAWGRKMAERPEGNYEVNKQRDPSLPWGSKLCIVHQTPFWSLKANRSAWNGMNLPTHSHEDFS
jgi:hypothetical protein